MKKNIFNHIRQYSASQWIYGLTIAFAFTLPLPFFNGKIGLFSVLLFMLWIAEGKIKEKMEIFSSRRFLVTFGIVLSYLLIVLILSDHIEKAWHSIRPFKYYPIIFIIILTSIPKEKLYSLIHSFVLGVVLFAALRLASEVITVLPYTKLHPAAHSIYTPFVGFAALFYLNRLLNSISRERKFIIINSLMFIVLFLIIFSYTGRAGKIGFILGMFVILMYQRRNLIRNLIFAVMVISTFVFLEYRFSKEVQCAVDDIKCITEENKYEGSWGARFGIWYAAGKVIQDNMLFGVGLGDGPDEIQRVIIRGENQRLYSVMWMDGVHSLFVYVFLELGLVGLILFLLFIRVLFLLPIESREVKILSYAFLTAFIFSSTADEVLFMKPYNDFFALMVAVFVAYGYNSSSDLPSIDSKEEKGS